MEEVTAYKTWTPRTFALVIFSALVPLLLFMATQGMKPLGALPRPVFMFIFLAPFAVTAAIARLAGVSKGRVRVDATGLWWSRADMPAAAQPLVSFAGIKSWHYVLSLYGRYIPLGGEKYPMLLTFTDHSGNAQAVTLVFPSAADFKRTAEALEAAIQRVSGSLGVVDGAAMGGRKQSWLETPKRKIVGWLLVVFAIGVMGFGLYAQWVEPGQPRSIRWIIKGAVALISGIWLLRSGGSPSPADDDSAPGLSP